MKFDATRLNKLLEEESEFELSDTHIAMSSSAKARGTAHLKEARKKLKGRTRQFSEEHIANLRAATSNLARIKCCWCGFESTIAQIHRYHNENCPDGPTPREKIAVSEETRKLQSERRKNKPKPESYKQLMKAKNQEHRDSLVPGFKKSLKNPIYKKDGSINITALIKRDGLAPNLFRTWCKENLP